MQKPMCRPSPSRIARKEQGKKKGKRAVYAGWGVGSKINDLTKKETDTSIPFIVPQALLTPTRLLYLLGSSPPPCLAPTSASPKCFLKISGILGPSRFRNCVGCASAAELRPPRQMLSFGLTERSDKYSPGAHQVFMQNLGIRLLALLHATDLCTYPSILLLMDVEKPNRVKTPWVGWGQ